MPNDKAFNECDFSDPTAEAYGVHSLLFSCRLLQNPRARKLHIQQVIQGACICYFLHTILLPRHAGSPFCSLTKSCKLVPIIKPSHLTACT